MTESGGRGALKRMGLFQKECLGFGLPTKNFGADVQEGVGPTQDVTRHAGVTLQYK